MRYACAEVMNCGRALLLTLWLPIVAAARIAASAAPATQPQAPVSMDQAVHMVEQRFHARVVKAETHGDGAHTVYALRLLDDAGRVWTVHVDAASGAVH